MDNFILLWALFGFIAPVIFFLLSKIYKVEVDKRTIFNNYFTYFILFQCFQILVARAAIKLADPCGLVLLDFLLFAFPVLTIVFYILKKHSFILVFGGYSVGMIFYYSLNIFEPGMSLNLNAAVIIEHMLILVLYYFFLKINFSHDLKLSVQNFKFWLLDFNKKEAIFALIPLFVLVFAHAILIIVIIYKFRHAILGRL